MNDTSLLNHAYLLAVALAVGFVIGLERGWQERELPDGGRVAGLRTFSFIGLLGGLLGMGSDPAVPLGVGMASVALLFAVSYARVAAATGNRSITTGIAALVTLALGALATSGQPVLAMACAVVVTALLGSKQVLHRWLRRIEPAELNALLQLAIVSAVILPLLPDKGYGPHEALNPFRLWIAVILVGSLSLLGHFAMRLAGQRQGLLWTGLLGGVASSTAATLALSNTAHATPALAYPAATAILGACGVMFVRMAVVIALLQTGTVSALVIYLVVLGAAMFLVTALAWRGAGRRAEAAQPPQAREAQALFDLPTALAFGVLLALVMLLSRMAIDHFGVRGLYGLAFLSGLADVDAIVISTVQLPGLETAQAWIAILLAVLANLLVKASMAWWIGGRAVGTRVALGYGAVALLGAGLIAAGLLR